MSLDTAQVKAISGETHKPNGSLGRPEVGLERVHSVHIEIVPHSTQRYDTVGDWFFRGDQLVIKVSRFEDARATLAIAVHELVEALLCTQVGVTPESVDAFDMGMGADCEDPGMHPSAPYHMQHIYAISVERRLVQTLGLPWEVYNEMVPQPH
jgi:hypothetical protein